MTRDEADTFDLLLVTLAAFRCTRFIGWDSLTHGARARLSGMTDAEFHAQVAAAEAPNDEPGKTATLLHCPHCIGFWVSVGWSVAYCRSPIATRRAALPFAISALVGFAARWLDP